MIPLIVSEPELELLEEWTREEADAVLRDANVELDYLVGTMIETPRAALVADRIADVAEFFSFGTNDLTQMTFGFSRDDIEGRFMAEYLELQAADGEPVRDARRRRRRPARADGLRDAAARRVPTSSSASAASTVAIPRRWRSATRSASTTCRARRTGCRSPASPPRTPRSTPAAPAPPPRDPVCAVSCGRGPNSSHKQWPRWGVSRHDRPRGLRSRRRHRVPRRRVVLGRGADAAEQEALAAANSRCYSVLHEPSGGAGRRRVAARHRFRCVRMDRRRVRRARSPRHKGSASSSWSACTDDLAEVDRLFLGTRDAHGLYAQFGFVPAPGARSAGWNACCLTPSVA